MGSKLWQKYENHMLNEGVSKSRMLKLRTMFNLVSRFVDFKTATRENIEKFVQGLNKNEYTKEDGGIYSGTTKQDVKKFLKQFYKWYKGDNEYYPKHVAWIKTRIPKDEKPQDKPIIDLKQVVKLSNKFTKPDTKLLTLLLFDSGFRIQEMQSVCKRDLTWEEFEDGKKCWWLKCNKSKTYTRKVPIPLFTETLSAYVKSPEFLAKESGEPLLSFSYTTYTNQLKANGMKLFNKNITCHCLRHSSATYYAREYGGDVPLLAQRFGWGFDAKELKTYVRLSGSYNRAGAKISYKNEVTELKAEIQAIKEQNKVFNKIMIKYILDKGKLTKAEIAEVKEIYKAI